MPTLNWIGKEAVVNHDKEVPFRLLKKIKAHSVGDNSQNLIIHGDNLEALKALMPYYIGKIKCIYIDPPYNTGNENWVYNDKVNSPKIKKWLGKIVGSDAQDLCRHDKWLCMMYPRLKLLKELLSDDGVIFVHCDDNEQAHLKLIMDDIFGRDNFVNNIIFKTKGRPQSDAKYLSPNHDIMVVYAKTKIIWRPNLLERTSEMDLMYKNPDNDSRGNWASMPLHAKSGSEKSVYKIKFPNGVEWTPPKGSYPRYNKERLLELYKDNRIWFGNKMPRLKTFLSEVKQGRNIVTIWDDVGGGTMKASLEITAIFGEKIFQTPKPIGLIKQVIKMTSNKNDIILDSFAGSGTTGHAVLNLNKEDGGNRKFILVELEDNIAKDITSKRIAKAIEKYDYKAGFEYCELDKPLFDENGKIDVDCSFEQLATYIYFIESNTNLNKKLINKNYIGNFNDIEYYLLYKEKGKNVLTKDFLKNITFSKNKKIVYADKCLIDEKNLLKYNIIFKQIPYEIKVF